MTGAAAVPIVSVTAWVSTKPPASTISRIYVPASDVATEFTVKPPPLETNLLPLKLIGCPFEYQMKLVLAGGWDEPAKVMIAAKVAEPPKGTVRLAGWLATTGGGTVVAGLPTM